MTTSPMATVLNRLEGVKKAGAGYVARCPGHHPDKNPSLSIDEGDDGRVLLKCHAGCDTAAVLAGAKLEVSDLFPSSTTSTNGHKATKEIVATYPYVDEDGAELFQAVRFLPKEFRQRRRAPGDPRADRDGWVWNIKGVRRVVYRLPDVLEAVANDVTVYIVEGEKDVHALEAAGEVATCCPMGAGKWKPEYNEVFKGADVVVVADADAPGRAHARQVAGALEGVAARVAVVESPTHKDAADHLAAGLSLGQLVPVAHDDAAGDEAAPEPSIDTSKNTELCVFEFLTAAELCADVDSAPPVGFLCRPVWPADAYGVFAAEKKAGKTWGALDLVVSVASGTPWLGIYPVERQGPVLVFLGEGGKRKMLRRLRAICASRGLRFEDLPIVVSFRVPHLTSAAHMSVIAAKVEALRPALVVVDPLYLAARGAKGASLYDMGSHLEAVQAVAQKGDAALMIVHHWNQTGTGSGSDRMSGAGPAEWGRVLVSAKVKAYAVDPGTRVSTATLDLRFEGDEIPGTDLRIRRRVWAEDPDDLSSPMHYEVEQLEMAKVVPADDADLSPATRRVLEVLKASAGALTVRVIGDRLAEDSTGLKPLKTRTIQDSLKELAEAELAESEELDGRTLVWRLAGAGAPWCLRCGADGRAPHCEECEEEVAADIARFGTEGRCTNGCGRRVMSAVSDAVACGMCVDKARAQSSQSAARLRMDRRAQLALEMVKNAF